MDKLLWVLIGVCLVMRSNNGTVPFADGGNL